MNSIIFTWNGVRTTIQYNKGDKIKDICQKYVQKTQMDINNLFFVYGGTKLNIDLENEEISKKIDNDNSANILVFDKNIEDNEDNPLKKSKNIICPKCQENCRIYINDYKITLSDCKNRHITKNILFENFKNTQLIDESKINCNICNNNKNKTYEKKFFKCLTCDKNLCPLCNSNHDKNHITIEYEKKNYFCKFHNELYVSYCENCKSNLCMQCVIEHNGHQFIDFKDIVSNKNEFQNKLIKFKEKIDKMNNIITKMIAILYKVNENMKNYFEIYNEIIKNYEIKNRNYEMFKNINYIQNTIHFEEVDKIINNNNIYFQFENIINIFNKMEKMQKINEMTIKYKIKGCETIKLFHEDFVKNNKENCILFIDGKEMELLDYLDVTKINNNEILEIKLKEIKPITNMYRMFRDCYQLFSLPDFSEWDTSNVTNLHSLFNGCPLLSFLSDISKWNTSNVTDMGYLFWGCKSLNNLPDISKWDTSKVSIMRGIFYDCFNLKSLPDISKWDTSKVTDMAELFRSCPSLEKLPDISNWNTSNVNDMSKLFYGCSSLSSLPNISKWNIKNVKDFKGMFDGLNKKIKIPKGFKS